MTSLSWFPLVRRVRTPVARRALTYGSQSACPICDPETMMASFARCAAACASPALRMWDTVVVEMSRPGPTETFGLGISLDVQREGDETNFRPYGPLRR
jgi:hypothetical protein